MQRIVDKVSGKTTPHVDLTKGKSLGTTRQDRRGIYIYNSPSLPRMCRSRFGSCDVRIWSTDGQLTGIDVCIFSLDIFNGMFVLNVNEHKIGQGR